MNKEVFQQIQEEVKQVHNEIISICKDNEKIKELYKGCQIYYSPLVELPDVMFLGINPGQGFYKHNNNELVEKFEPLEKHEYIEHSYILADSWRNIFTKDLNRIDLLEKSFKTNMFFWATKDEKELEMLLGALNKSRKEIGDEIVLKSRKWIRTMVVNLSPRVLIVEGKFALKELEKCFLKGEFEKYDNNSGYLKIDSQEGYLDCYLFCTTRCYSNMKNVDNVVEFLQDKIDLKLIGEK